MSLGLFTIVLAVAAAALALWTLVRFPRVGPDTFVGALVQVAIAVAAGWVLVPAGMTAALAVRQPAGALLAVFVFALPSLVYLFLTSLWAMRVLQRMLLGARH